jgi:hypothetical protein
MAKTQRPAWRKHLKRRTIIERIEIVGPVSERQAVFDSLPVEDGWSFKSGGPYTNKKMFPKCDTSRFRLTVEREVKPGVRGRFYSLPPAPGST